jgi:hypothetical protein
VDSLELWLIVALALVLLAKGVQAAIQYRRARASEASGPILIENWYEVEPPEPGARGRTSAEPAVPAWPASGAVSAPPLFDLPPLAVPNPPPAVPKPPTAAPSKPPSAPAWGHRSASPSAPPLTEGIGSAERATKASPVPPPAARPAARPAAAAREVPPVPPPGTPAPIVPPHDSRASEYDETSDTIRIDVGSSGLVQLLPGRLEVLKGAEPGREFHFVRPAGQKVPEITIGRSSGSASRHIQIPQPTVSRLHARLRFEDGLWTLANLSSTNPVRVNGCELGSAEEVVGLQDGDRIELGEVEMLFHEKRT